jgi:hypothetical protein
MVGTFAQFQALAAVFGHKVRVAFSEEPGPTIPPMPTGKVNLARILDADSGPNAFFFFPFEEQPLIEDFLAAFPNAIQVLSAS